LSLLAFSGIFHLSDGITTVVYLCRALH